MQIGGTVNEWKDSVSRMKITVKKSPLVDKGRPFGYLAKQLGTSWCLESGLEFRMSDYKSVPLVIWPRLPHWEKKSENLKMYSQWTTKSKCVSATSDQQIVKTARPKQRSRMTLLRYHCCKKKKKYFLHFLHFLHFWQCVSIQFLRDHTSLFQPVIG